MRGFEMWTWLEEFLLMSLPDQFLMALFIWIVLGRKETVKFINVVFVGLSAAIVFNTLQNVLEWNSLLVFVPQVLILMLMVIFVYKLNFIEALVGTLTTFVISATLQVTLINLFGVLALERNNILEDIDFRYFFSVIYYTILIILNYVCYKKNINIYYLKLNKLDKSQIQRVRFLILNLVFALFFIVINFTIYYRNVDIFKTYSEKMLLALSVISSVVFSVFLINTVFKIGDIIKKEEELKRQQDGREIIQNIDYLYTLINRKEYGELKKALDSIKEDVDNGIINNKK